MEENTHSSKQWAEEKLARVIDTAILTKDIRLLKRLQHPIKLISEDLKRKMDQLILDYDKRENSLAQLSKLLKTREMTLGIDTAFLKPLEISVYQLALKRIKMRDAALSTAAATLMGKEVKNKWNIILTLWDAGLLPGNWESMLRVRDNLSNRQLFADRVKVLGDKSIIDYWANPLSAKEFRSESDEKLLEVTKQKLGALTRLKWIKKYDRGQKTVASLLTSLEGSDLS